MTEQTTLSKVIESALMGFVLVGIPTFEILTELGLVFIAIYEGAPRWIVISLIGWLITNTVGLLIVVPAGLIWKSAEHFALKNDKWFKLLRIYAILGVIGFSGAPHWALVLVIALGVFIIIGLLFGLTIGMAIRYLLKS